MPTWKEIIARNPHHSEEYAARWRRIAASGKDIFGEARLIDALVPRQARILDAGCGTGRIGGWLSRRGHRVDGIDLDPVLIEHARQDYPEATWEVGDLGIDPLPQGRYDAVVCAGNVMGFIEADRRAAAVKNIARSLAPGGRAAVGFGAGRGWEFPDFLDTCRSAGLEVEHQYSTWDMRPFTRESDFLVAVLRS
ncbi:MULTISPECIES: class I SAM-dependent methyltransferase [unclassified Corynebacterium]|uniref:class I SAM-dependent methyltransferase n=1 Tax=unclassified Corynebacterium TaxID=2624378 RepID=UPI0029CA7364|nr:MULTISPECIES: class I SAM-dependent methyltransferase [unclassified Corynebacterium]WPF67156.1 class I SAM-dependent methyltransferase [Corynebacterium sp. 22KM0430]WPF69645.1 class I SAM-dependent methyltransferase [Corynebacterium sp. 21KM1197]